MVREGDVLFCEAFERVRVANATARVADFKQGAHIEVDVLHDEPPKDPLAQERIESLHTDLLQAVSRHGDLNDQLQAP